MFFQGEKHPKHVKNTTKMSFVSPLQELAVEAVSL